MLGLGYFLSLICQRPLSSLSGDTLPIVRNGRMTQGETTYSFSWDISARTCKENGFFLLWEPFSTHGKTKKIKLILKKQTHAEIEGPEG